MIIKITFCLILFYSIKKKTQEQKELVIFIIYKTLISVCTNVYAYSYIPSFYMESHRIFTSRAQVLPFWRHTIRYILFIFLKWWKKVWQLLPIRHSWHVFEDFQCIHFIWKGIICKDHYFILCIIILDVVNKCVFMVEITTVIILAVTISSYEISVYSYIYPYFASLRKT